MQFTLKLHTLATLILTAALTACGGGGGGGDSSSAPTPTPAPTPEVPAGSTGDSGTLDSTTYTGDKLAYFNALNEARAKAGLAPVKQNTKLDEAAQGHAEYVHLNGFSEMHDQTEGKPGYTGQVPSTRAKNALYDAPVGEVMLGAGRAVDYPIEAWLSSIYHRAGPLDAATADVGFARHTFTHPEMSGDFKVTVLDYGVATKVVPNATGYWVWPYDGATDLQISYSEIPNPAPDLAELGYAISVTVNPGDAISAESFNLNCNGQDVPSRLITSANDINKLVTSDWVFLQPETALPHGATCTASFLGSSTKLGKFNKTWSFNTIAALK